MYQSLEKRGQFFYFKSGDTTRARHTVGKLLASAGLDVTICDMYLNGKGFDDCVKGWLKCERLTIFASKQRLPKKEWNPRIQTQNRFPHGSRNWLTREACAPPVSMASPAAAAAAA